jgi:cell division septum initiation protein DivIVA
LQAHIGEQRLQDCERQLQQAHSAAQALAAEKSDLHSQLASLEQELLKKASLSDRIAELEAQVSMQSPLLCMSILSWSGDKAGPCFYVLHDCPSNCHSMEKQTACSHHRWRMNINREK